MQFRWECKCDVGWRAYSADVEAVLENSFKQQLPLARIVINEVPYEVRFQDMKQKRVDGKYNTVRQVRRVES